MTLTVRLDPDLEREFEEACAKQHATKSDVVVRLVRQFVALNPTRSSYDIAKEVGLIGCARGGNADLSANAKAYARKAIRAKHSR